MKRIHPALATREDLAFSAGYNSGFSGQDGITKARSYYLSRKELLPHFDAGVAEAKKEQK